MQSFDTDLLMTPRTIAEVEADGDEIYHHQFVTDISSNNFTDVDLDVDLESFQFDIDGETDLFDFYGELDPMEAAEARALVTELQTGTSDILDSLAAASTIKAQHDVYDLFQASNIHKAQSQKRRKRPITACDDTDGSVAEVTAVLVKGSPSLKRTCIDRNAPTSVSASSTAVTGTSKKSAGGYRGTDGPQRTVPWRKRGSPENTRMRAAVWVYRFAPRVKSKAVQQHFRVSVKSLMRYVYDSCQPEFAAYDLYFGPAGEGPAGRADRALRKSDGRVPPATIGYVVDMHAEDVPAMAREFLVASGK